VGSLALAVTKAGPGDRGEPAGFLIVVRSLAAG
jgi:hypothetical protein